MDNLRKFAKYVRLTNGNRAGIFYILVSMAFGLFIPYFVGEAVDDLNAGLHLGTRSSITPTPDPGHQLHERHFFLFCKGGR